MNRFRFARFWLSVGIAMATVALAPCVALAQQPAQQPGSAGVRVLPTPSASGPMTALKLQVVVTRSQGQKQVSREPFTLAVNSNDYKVSEVTSATQVFIPMVTVEGKTVGPVFKDVGTHITCTATTVDGRYRLDLMVESALLPPEDEKAKAVAAPPYRIRSFRSSQPLLLRDGQTMEYTTATDPVNGEEVKVAVTLTVVK
jgi:hypothetical protein